MNIAIIDDYENDSLLITDYLKLYFSESCRGMHFFLHTFSSGEKFLQSFSAHFFDLIILDYFMNGLTGLETARSIRNKDANVPILLTTASPDYAIDGYKVKASGYLVKPVKYEDFSQLMSLLDFKRKLEDRIITVDTGKDCLSIPVKNVIYCDISGHYVQIHTIEAKTLRIRMTFSDFMPILEPYPEFLFCNRGCIINMEHVDRHDESTFYMKGGDRIPLRRKQQSQLLKIYMNYIFGKVRNAKA